MNTERGTSTTSADGAQRGFSKPALVVLGTLIASNALIIDFYNPALPDLATSLGTSPALAQLTLSVALIGLALGHLIVGPLSDRIGRLPPLFMGYTFLAVTFVLSALVPNIWWLLPLRFLQGLSVSAGVVLGYAIVRDVHTGSRAARVFSQLLVIVGLCRILASLSGGQVLRFTDWRGVFLIVAGLALLIALTTRLVLRETHPPSARSTEALTAYWRSLGRLMTDRDFLAFFLFLGLHGAVIVTYGSMGSFVFRAEYGIGPVGFSIIFAANSVGLILGSQINAALVMRFGPARMLQAALLLSCVATVLVTVALVAGASLVLVLVPLFFVVMASGMKMGSQMALALAPYGATAGAAAALFGLAIFGSGSLVPPLVSLGSTSGWAMGTTMATASVSALVLWFVVLRPKVEANASARTDKAA